MMYVAPWPVLVIVAVLAALAAAYQVFRPIPAADLKDIELFLRNRQERLATVKNMVLIGVPQVRITSFFGIGESIRKYKIVAHSPDGKQWLHVLAIIGGRPSPRRMWRQVDRTWQPVLQ